MNTCRRCAAILAVAFALSAPSIWANQSPIILGVNAFPNPANAGQSISFSVTAYDPDGDFLSYQWNFGDGGVGFGQNPTHSYSTAGMYAANVMVSDMNGGSTFTYLFITINPGNQNPIIYTLNASPNPALTGQSVVFSVSASDPDGDMVSVFWNFGDSYSDFGPTVYHAYSTQGMYNAQVTVTDNRGGSATGYITVTVQNQPPTITDARATPSTGVRGQSIAFLATATDPDIYDTLTFTWNFGDSSPTVTGSSVTHSYTAIGNYTAMVAVDDGHGGSVTRAVAVTIQNQDPQIITAKATPATANTAQNITFEATAYDPDNDELIYLWTFSATEFQFGTPAVHSYAAVGVYTATLEVYDNHGGKATKDVTVNVVNRPPQLADPTADPNPGKVNQIIAFNASATDPDVGQTLNYTWNFGDNSATETGAVVTHPYTAVGTYTATVVVEDGYGGTDSKTIGVEIKSSNQDPVITSVTSSSYVVTTGTSVSISASATDADGDPLSFSYDFGDGGVASGAATSSSFGDFGAAVSSSLGDSGTFNAASSSASASASSSTANSTAIHSYSQPGTYTVKVTVSDGNGGSASSEIVIDVTNRDPEITAAKATPNPAAVGENISFSATATDFEDSTLNYAWDFGDSGMATGASAVHTYAAAGIYTATLTVTDTMGGSASQNLIIYIPAQFNSGLALSVPAGSAVSPMFIEGQAWSTDGQPFSVAANGTSLPVTFISETKFFVNAPLNANGTATPISITQSPTGTIVAANTVWQPTDLSLKDSTTGDHIVIRKGDALLLTVSHNGHPPIAIDPDGNGIKFTGKAGDKFAFTYNTAGVFVATGSLAQGHHPLGTLQVIVMDVDLHKPIADRVGYKRVKNVVVTPAALAGNVAFSSGDPASLAVAVKGPFSNADGEGTAIYLTALKRGTPVLVARLSGDSGPIVAFKEVDEFTVDNEALLDAMINEETGIGSALLTIRPYIPNIRFQFDMFASTTTFANGATSISVNTSDLDSATGEPLFRQVYDAQTNEVVGMFEIVLEMPPGETMYCFSHTAYQASSQEQEIEPSEPGNGVACTARLDRIIICKDDGKRDLYITLVTNKAKSGHEHEVTIFSEDKPPKAAPKFTNSGNQTSTVKFNCKLDPGPQDIGEVSAAGAAVGDYSVKVGGATFQNKIKVTDQKVCINLVHDGHFTPLPEFEAEKRVRLVLTLGDSDVLGVRPDAFKNGGVLGFFNVVELQGTVCDGSPGPYTFRQSVKYKRWLYDPGLDQIGGGGLVEIGEDKESPSDDIQDKNPADSALHKIYTGDGPGTGIASAAQKPKGFMILLRQQLTTRIIDANGVQVSDIMQWQSDLTIIKTGDPGDNTWVRSKSGKNKVHEGFDTLEVDITEARKAKQ